MKKCDKCDVEMFTADICSIFPSPAPLILRKRNKGFFETECRSELECYVCPECGYIELYAKEPKKIRGRG